MKRQLLTLLFILGAGAVSAFAAPPVIFFSDLTSGPATGGKNNNGVFVTVVGKNFGSDRGTGSVSVGGGTAADYPVWSDTKISFQLGPNATTGNITVRTPEGTSNGIRFTVRPGRIFFVDDTSPGSPGSGTFDDPWRSPRSFFTSQQPGDTCYIRGGTYTGQYGNASRPYNVSFYNSGVPNGSPDNEIAWVGYPGETAKFVANDGTVYNGAFEFISDNQYFVIAGLSIYGKGDGREQVRLYSNNDKLVNCKIEGIKTLSYAMIGITASNLKIWGNECFGATSANKLDHIFYFQGPGDNVDIGWNYVHDNDIAVGPMFSWNISGNSTNIRIHDNRLDCRNSSDIVRLAGIWSGSGGSIWFTNNIVIGAGGSLAGDSSYNAIYNFFAQTYVHNNTFYLSRGAGNNSVVYASGGGSADVRNNVFYNQSSIGYAQGNVTLTNNLYYGAGGAPSGDPHAVSADPLFVNAAAQDFHISANSPAVDKGTDTTATVPRDYDGVIRRTGAIDIGAFEYYIPSAELPAETVSISGTVRDLLNSPVSGAAVSISGSAELSAVTDAVGAYTVTVPKGSGYLITLVKDGYGFTPSTRTIANLAADLAGQDFTARKAYRVEGHVTDSHGSGIAGAIVVASCDLDSRTVISDATGLYVFPQLLEGLAYKLTTQKDGYVFEPALRALAALSAPVASLDFAAVNIGQLLSPGDVKVIGSSDSRGTVNPGKGETARIYFQGSDAGKFDCRIFALDGETIWESTKDNTRGGMFEWSPGTVASGIYVVHVKGPGVNKKQKIAVLK